MAKKKKKEKKKYSENKQEALVEVIDLVHSEFGDGSLIIGKPNISCDIIPTGILTVDLATDVGGIPRGRITEIFGPEYSGKTTLALAVAASAQKQGGVVAFIDAEHALDSAWTAKIGVDLEKILFSQPDYGEQALQIVERLAASGAVDLIIIDSVSALVPKAEIEGEIGDHHVGAQARMMSQALRMLNGVTHKTNTAIIFINQLRMKIGVSFGCLHADNKINFVDGRSIRIKDVVTNRIKGEVWSYNEDNRTFVPSKIVDWHCNGKVKSKDDYLSIAIKGPGNKNGRMNIIVTPDHKVMTQSGWAMAKDLRVGSKLLSKQRSLLTDTFGDFLKGVLSGDSHIATAKGHLSSSLKIRDNVDPDYMKWKINKLNEMNFVKSIHKGYTYFSSAQYSELNDIKNNFPNRDPMILLSEFNWVGFAVWIMDDATYARNRYSLSIKRFKGNFDKLDQISRRLDQIGLYHYMSNGGRIQFDKNVSDKIASNIGRYVPQCMRHKLPSIANAYIEFKLNKSQEFTSTYAEVVRIKHPNKRQMLNFGKYDISVEEHHNYSVGGKHNGVIVHNSPETTSGGRALRFYSSLRLDIRKIGTIKDGTEAIGNQTRVKVVKNKVGRPFRTGEFEISFSDGINKAGCLIDVAVSNSILRKSGGNHYWKEIKLGASRNATVQFLKENQDVYGQIEAEVYEKIYVEDEDNGEFDQED